MRNFWFPAESSPLYWKAPTCGFISLLPFNSTFWLAGNSVFLQLTICWPFFCAVKESCYASGFIASNWDWFLYWKISTHAYQLTSAINMTRTSLHSNKKIAPQSDCLRQQIEDAVLLFFALKATMYLKWLTTLLNQKSRRFIALSSLCFTPVFTPIWE